MYDVIPTIDLIQISNQPSFHLRTQGFSAERTSYSSNALTHDSDYYKLRSDVDLYDLQHLAVHSRCVGSWHRLLPVWLEKNSDC